MNSKRLISVILLVLFLLAMPIQAMAMESVTVEVLVTVENTPGTVVIEAVDDAPLPIRTELSDVTEGSFELTFSEPGHYAYKVYQKQELDDYTSYYRVYDDTVYDVVVSIFADENDKLYGVVTACIPGDSYKPEEIVFVNESETADLSIRKTQALGEETPTTELINVEPGDKITYFITVSNNTEGSVYDVEVTDEIPEGLELVEGSISNGGSEKDRVVSWDLGIMGPGDSMTVSFTATVPDVTRATTWTNIAKGSFINQTGRVNISSRTMTQTGSANIGAGTKSLDAPSARQGSEPQVILLDTNEVQAVYTPAGFPPITGDFSNLALWITLLAASLTGIIFLFFVVIRRKKRDEENEQDSEQ